MIDMLKKFAFAAALLALGSWESAQAGTATANLTVQIKITASCTSNAASLTSPFSTSLTSAAVSANTPPSVTCSDASPYSIGMGQGGL